MKYKDIIAGTFIDRPNRFVANVEINGISEKVHVKNTGRCKELLENGNTVYVEDFRNKMGTRKLSYSLISVRKRTENGTMLINMDSQIPNKVVHEGLSDGSIVLPGMSEPVLIKPEKKYGNSRFDFYVEDSDKRCAYAEVKGVTLERDGTAFFPDAPTKRGSKHVKELVNAAAEGYKSYIIFVVQIEGIETFRPNRETDPEFADALSYAAENGVHILAYNCIVNPDELRIDKKIKTALK